MEYLIKTDEDDLSLFARLGLPPYELPLWEEKLLGEVRFVHGAWIKISVECAPAQFWRFRIYTSETGRTYRVRTGSGTLTEYWPFAVQIAEGMLVIDTISTAGAVEPARDKKAKGNAKKSGQSEDAKTKRRKKHAEPKRRKGQ